MMIGNKRVDSIREKTENSIAFIERETQLRNYVFLAEYD